MNKCFKCSKEGKKWEDLEMCVNCDRMGCPDSCMLWINKDFYCGLEKPTKIEKEPEEPQEPLNYCFSVEKH